MIETVAGRVAGLEARISGSRRRVQERLGDLDRAPRGRQLVLLRNAPPALLLQLARALLRQSFEARFDEPGRSLRLARLGLGCVEVVADSDHLSPELVADLQAEALAYLGNALRINSDLAAAEEALENATELVRWGTGDRALKADLASLLSSLRFSQGRIRAAAALLEREIALRRILGDTERLGHAMIDRGIVAAWDEPLASVCHYLGEGVARVGESERILLALQSLAERLARDGDGGRAQKVLGVAESVASLVEGDSHRLRLRWIRGVSLRASGDLDAAARELETVRERLAVRGARFKAGLVALDLAAVHAAAGRPREVRRLAQEAFAVFRRERLERRALAAFLVFHRAALAERADEELTVRVANLVARRLRRGAAGRQGATR